MTITLYKNNTSLASYTNALFEEKMKAVSRALVSSVSYLQTQVQTVKTDATSVASALSTIESIQQSLNALETKCEDALTQMENIAVSYGNTWYGSLSSDPTENPWDNGPLMIGARYYNTTSKIIRIYTSSGWQDYDASDEQIQLEVASIYAKILTAQQAVNTAEQNTVTAANSIITPIKQFETLFPTPMVAGGVPVVNSAGTGFGFTNVSELGGYIKAWSSATASRGGYPQYAVVADPTLSGMLYESKISSNDQKPSLTSSDWSLFSTSPFINVTSFGVVNDPTGDNVVTNTQNYLLALQQCAGEYCLVHPVGLTVVISGLSLQQDDIQWRLDGTIILNNNENSDVISLTEGIQNFYLFGNGTINGSLLGNQNTNGQGNSTALGSCISVNATTTNLTNSQPETHNIVVEGLTLKNAQYAFYGNNCNSSTVRKCRALQTTYGIIFSNGYGNKVEDCISAWNGQLGVGINNTAYNTSIKNCRINSNWNQAINVYADGTQQPPQFCIISDNFIRDNFTNGVNITVPTPSQTSTTAVLSPSDTVTNPITDLKIMNNVFQNNGRGGTGNDVTANAVNELLISGNLFDRFANAYQGTLSSSPNAVWINSSCEYVDVHSNTFKNVGSINNPGIQLWLNYPQSGTVHSNTFMDTMGVTQNWWGGSIDGYNTINYNVTVGSLTSSDSNIAILKGGSIISYVGFTGSYPQGYTTVAPSSSNNNQAQCVWELTINPEIQGATVYTWQELLAFQATITSGNTDSLQTIFGIYSQYSIEPPVLTITSIQVNGVDIPLDSTSSAVSLADFNTIQFVSSQPGKGWQIETSSGNLIYSVGENTGDFEPGFCPPESVFITFEIVANNTVDGSTVPTVPTTSTGTGTSSTTSSSGGESMTVYASDNWNEPFQFQIPTYLNTVNTLRTLPIIHYPTYPRFYGTNEPSLSTSTIDVHTEWMVTYENESAQPLLSVLYFYRWTPSFRAGLSWKTLIGSNSNTANEFVYPVLKGSDHKQEFPIEILSVEINGQNYTYAASNGNLVQGTSTSNTFVLSHPSGRQIHGVVLHPSFTLISTETHPSCWIGIEYTTGELCLGMGGPYTSTNWIPSGGVTSFDLPSSLTVTFEITRNTSGTTTGEYIGVPFTVTPCLSKNAPATQNNTDGNEGGDNYVTITYSPSSPVTSSTGDGASLEWSITGTNVPWIDILGKSAEGNGKTLSELFGNYAYYSSSPPTLKLVKVVVNGVEEPLNYEAQSYTTTSAPTDRQFGGLESPGTPYSQPYPCSQIFTASENDYGGYVFPPSQWSQIAQACSPEDSDTGGYGIDASNGNLFFGNTVVLQNMQSDGGNAGYYSGSPISSGTVEIYFVLEQNYISDGSGITQSGTTYYASNYWNQTIYGKQTV